MKKNNLLVCLRTNHRIRAVLLVCFAGLVITSANAQVNDAGTIPALPKRNGKLCVGFSTIFEDGYKPFNSFGPTLSYTHPLVGRLGVTGHAGCSFGKINDANYTKFLLLGGVSLLPKNEDGITFSPHLLAGIANDRIKYKFENTSSTSKGTEVSIAAGTNVLIPVNNRTTVVARADYNPSLSMGGTKNNFSVGVGVNLNFGVKKAVTPRTEGVFTTRARDQCKASKDVRELKISLAWIEEIAKSVEEIANKIPRVEAKVYIRPEVTVRQGEECCSRDKPPASWTEIKGGVEGGFEVNLNLWGIPDINYSVKIWPVLIIAQFQCKLFAGPTGKISLEPVGKFYGELLGERRPDCSACFYWNLKAEGFVRIGVKAGGKINLYHWSPFGNGKAGFDVTGEPDETLEVSAEASASIGETFSGTYTTDPGCRNPQPGLHGMFKLGKAKANLRFNVRLGPISFDPSFELNLFDGFEFPF